MLFPIAMELDKTTRPFLRGAALLADGNSIMTNAYAGADSGIVPQLASILSMRDIRLSSATTLAVGGQTTRQMIDDASVQIDGLLKTPAYRDATSRILLVFEGSNDLYFRDQTTPDRVKLCFEALKDYCFLRRSAGWYVVLMGTTPRFNGYPPGSNNPALYESDMVALDTLLESRYPEFCSLYFSTRRLVPSYKSVAPYVVDGVHPGDYGCGLIASALASFLIDNLRTD
jgi:hypothetical protein